MVLAIEYKEEFKSIMPMKMMDANSCAWQELNARSPEIAFLNKIRQGLATSEIIFSYVRLEMIGQ